MWKEFGEINLPLDDILLSFTDSLILKAKTMIFF
jgi:hypothetical protein